LAALVEHDRTTRSGIITTNSLRTLRNVPGRSVSSVGTAGILSRLAEHPTHGGAVESIPDIVVPLIGSNRVETQEIVASGQLVTSQPAAIGVDTMSVGKSSTLITAKRISSDDRANIGRSISAKLTLIFSRKVEASKTIEGVHEISSIRANLINLKTTTLVTEVNIVVDRVQEIAIFIRSFLQTARIGIISLGAASERADTLLEEEVRIVIQLLLIAFIITVSNDLNTLDEGVIIPQRYNTREILTLTSQASSKIRMIASILTDARNTPVNTTTVGKIILRTKTASSLREGLVGQDGNRLIGGGVIGIGDNINSKPVERLKSEIVHDVIETSVLKTVPVRNFSGVEISGAVAQNDESLGKDV